MTKDSPPTTQNSEEENDWWGSIPDLDVVEDINPDLFSFGEKNEAEEEQVDAVTASTQQLGEKLDESIERIEELTTTAKRAVEAASETDVRRAIPAVPLPERVAYGALYYIKRIVLSLLVVVVGSIVATWLLNKGTNPEFGLGDAVDFWIGSIKGFFEQFF